MHPNMQFFNVIPYHCVFFECCGQSARQRTFNWVRPLYHSLTFMSVVDNFEPCLIFLQTDNALLLVDVVMITSSIVYNLVVIEITNIPWAIKKTAFSEFILQVFGLIITNTRNFRLVYRSNMASSKCIPTGSNLFDTTIWLMYGDWRYWSEK